MRSLELFAAILFLVGPVRVLAGAFPPNEYVRLEVRPASTIMRPGVAGLIELRFFPADGIHVNVDPPVKFSLDSATGLVLNGRPLMTADARSGYLSTTAPVQQKVTLGRKVAPGQCTVKGTVTYFFCSDSEGWCKRQKVPVEFTILVKP